MSEPAGGTGRSSSRRELGTVVLLVLVGAFLLLVSTAGAWVTGIEARPAPLPSSTLEVGADEAAGPVRALGLVVLAGVPALLATRRSGRTAVGVLLVLAGVAAGVAAARVLADPQPLVDAGGISEVTATGRPLLAVAGALVTAAAGAAVVARGRRWAAMSRRYETPAARQEEATAGLAEPPELWDALDRGEDPTRG